MTPPAMMPAAEVFETTNHIIVLFHDILCKVYYYHHVGLPYSGLSLPPIQRYVNLVYLALHRHNVLIDTKNNIRPFSPPPKKKYAIEIIEKQQF